MTIVQNYQLTASEGCFPYPYDPAYRCWTPQVRFSASRSTVSCDREPWSDTEVSMCS